MYPWHMYYVYHVCIVLDNGKCNKNVFEIMIVTATLEQSTYYTPPWSATLFACFAKVLATHAMQIECISAYSTWHVC